MGIGSDGEFDYLSAVPAYYFSSMLAFSGVCIGLALLPVGMQSEAAKSEFYSEGGMVAGHSSWDAVWYAEIATDSYSYDPNKASSVAFFPAYPLLARAVRWVIGFRAQSCLLIVSHVALLSTFLLFPFYLKQRYGRDAGELSATVVAAFALFPTTFFFRMAYTEALFVLLIVVVLYGMEKNWPLVVLAFVAGIATATRGTGLALMPVVAWHLWTRSESLTSFAGRAVVLLPLACWGLIAYMAYLHAQFGDALVFSKTQQHWALRPDPQWLDRIIMLLTLEPVWSVYVPGTAAYWKQYELVQSPLVSMQFANPIFFVGTAALVGIGAWKKWLNTNELILSACLLLIPYLTHSYRSGMMGHARYAAVVFPAYIVMGKLLQRCPQSLAYFLFAFGGLMLGLYSALFAAWYRII